MSMLTMRAVAICTALATTPPIALAVHPGGHDVPWGDAPPILAKGAKLAVLQGDPSKPGPFVMRLKAPSGYRVMPHSHTQIENVTVISGELKVGMGDQWDSKTMKTFKAGDFEAIPAKANHFAQFKGPTVIQIHGEGPFDLIYVNPNDDPQTNPGTKTQK